MENLNMSTHEVYCSLDICKLLKEAGFDWEVRTCRYNSSPDKVSSNGALTSNFNGYAFQHIAISAPTLDVAQRWLRENKDFDINVLTDFDSVKRLYYVRYVVKDGHYKTYYISNNQSYVYFNTYEEAQEAGIKRALELILEKGE